jgi:hypothetical protein
MREAVAPLRFSAASLVSTCAGVETEESEILFSAGSSLWPVMVEVDNSMARSVEMLLAVRHSFACFPSVVHSC